MGLWKRGKNRNQHQGNDEQVGWKRSLLQMRMLWLLLLIQQLWVGRVRSRRSWTFPGYEGTGNAKTPTINIGDRDAKDLRLWSDNKRVIMSNKMAIWLDPNHPAASKGFDGVDCMAQATLLIISLMIKRKNKLLATLIAVLVSVSCLFFHISPKVLVLVKWQSLPCRQNV